MSLLVLWNNNPDQIRRYALRQIVAMAGDGRILDGSVCSNEIRTFLTQIDPEALETFAIECFEEGFDGSGYLLQDIVNEIGRRLEFDVEPGLYRGRRGSTGFDGAWRDGEGLEFVTEIKTTDSYNANLDVVEKYRRALINEGRLAESSSILFVVGRKDTGALEAQIRGSRHAWTMRVIGIASLIKLLKVKVKSDSNTIISRIKALLRPIEYTRVDGIVDLLFDAAAEASSDVQVDPSSTEDGNDQPRRAASGIASEGIEGLREQAAEFLSRKLKARLVRQRRSLFAAADGSVRAVLAVSKRYDRDYQAYWYGFYDSQKRFLEEAPTGYLVLGTLDTRRIYTLPLEFIEPLLDRMKTTIRDENQMYWHIATKLVGDDCRLVVSGDEISLAQYETRL